MPMTKRRVKARENPKLLWDAEHRVWYEEGSPPRVQNANVPRWMDLEYELALANRDSKNEELGRKIGIALHWMLVKPFQLAFALAYVTVLILKFILTHFILLCTYAWLIFFFGGIVYFYFQITGG